MFLHLVVEQLFHQWVFSTRGVLFFGVRDKCLDHSLHEVDTGSLCPGQKHVRHFELAQTETTIFQKRALVRRNEISPNIHAS